MMLFIARGIKKVCLAGFAIVLTTSASWAFTYTIDSNPQGAVVINVITKERMGLTPIKVDIPDTQEGKTFGILYKDYRNVALMIYKPAPTAERAFTNSPPVVVTREGANKQVISSQADSLIKISRIWADFFPANTSNQPI